MLSLNLRLRSFLFLPANNPKYLDKGLQCEADALILDVEDSVPRQIRPEARDNICRLNEQEAFRMRANIFVRINPIGTDDFVEDMERLTLPGIDGFMPSKVETAKDMEFLDRLLSFYETKKGLPSGKFKLAPLIETTKAIEEAGAIAGASSRLVALCLGGEDYLNDLGSVFTYQESALAFPRAVVANAARAHGLLPIDTPYLDIRNVEGFREHCFTAYQNGFAGGLILSPRQIETANEAYSPDEAEVAFSKRVIAAVRETAESGTSGVAMLDGSMVGPPMRKRAETVLKQAGEM